MVATPYKIFLNEKILEGFEKDLDLKEIKKKATFDWKNIDPEKKEKYLKRKKIKDNWIEKVKRIKKVSGLTLFIQKRFQEKKSNTFPLLNDIIKLYKELKPSEKRKYENYAEEINEEREKLRSLYELY